MHLQHKVFDDSVELAPLVMQRDALRRLALVSLAKVQEVGASLGARVGVQLERDPLRLLVPHLAHRRPSRQPRKGKNGKRGMDGRSSP